MNDNTTATGDDQWQMKFLNVMKNFFLQCWSCRNILFCLPHTSTTVTGTIICPVNGEQQITLCIQQDSETLPTILLDLPLNTSTFTTLIECGIIRMVLECRCGLAWSKQPLLSMPRWVMHCNGKKMGIAKRREVTEKDRRLLEMMQTISAGAGVLPGKSSGGFKYLRGQFEQVAGNDDYEAYYLIDPSGCFGQELSVFFLRN